MISNAISAAMQMPPVARGKTCSLGAGPMPESAKQKIEDALVRHLKTQGFEIHASRSTNKGVIAFSTSGCDLRVGSEAHYVGISMYGPNEIVLSVSARSEDMERLVGPNKELFEKLETEIGDILKEARLKEAARQS